MNNAYLEVISLVERLHRHFLEVVKLELEGLGIHDINNVQGMMLFNIGDAEMTVGELTLRGCYLGSNVSYNVKKMVENGYLAQQRSLHDRRSIHVRLTEKGIRLRDRLTEMHRRHAEMLPQGLLSVEDLQSAGAADVIGRSQRQRQRRADRAALSGGRHTGLTAGAARDAGRRRSRSHAARPGHRVPARQRLRLESLSLGPDRRRPRRHRPRHRPALVARPSLRLVAARALR